MHNRMPTIKTVNDIKRVLEVLDPNNIHNKTEVNDTKLSVELNSPNNTFKVDSTSKTKSYRDMIIDAISDLRSKQDIINNINSKTSFIQIGNKSLIPQPPLVVSNKLPIDSIISGLLGGYRDGYDICWDLSDGYIYKYDICNHKLVRISK